MTPTGRSVAMKKSKRVTRIRHNSRSLRGFFAPVHNQKAPRVEERDRRIVRNIVEPGETEEFIHRMREKYYSLADLALTGVRRALEIKADAKLASLVLQDVGAASSKTDPQGLPLQASEKTNPSLFIPSPEGRIVADALKFEYKN